MLIVEGRSWDELVLPGDDQARTRHNFSSRPAWLITAGELEKFGILFKIEARKISRSLQCVTRIRCQNNGLTMSADTFPPLS